MMEVHKLEGNIGVEEMKRMKEMPDPITQENHIGEQENKLQVMSEAGYYINSQVSTDQNDHVQNSDSEQGKCSPNCDAICNDATDKPNKSDDLIINKDGKQKLMEKLYEIIPKYIPKPPPEELKPKNGRPLPRSMNRESGGPDEARDMLNSFGPKYVTKDGNTLLHRCVDKTPAHVYILANSGVPVNIQNSDGDTALHIAVKKDKFEIVQSLLQCSADLSIRNKLGQTVLDLSTEGPIQDSLLRYQLGAVAAVVQGKWQVLDRLCKHTWSSTETIVKEGKNLIQLARDRAETDENISNCCRILHEYRSTSELIHAVLAEDALKVKSALESAKRYSVNVRYRDRLGKTLLSHAIESNNLEIVHLLVQAGARVNRIRIRESEKDSVTVPLFHKALKKGINLDIVEYLLSVQDSSEWIERDSHGNTAILRAIEEGCSDKLIHTLMVAQKGHNITHRNKDGFHARELAMVKGRPDIVLTVDTFILQQLNNFYLIHLPVNFYGSHNLNFVDQKSGKTLSELVETSQDKNDIVCLQHNTDIELRGVILFEAAARGDLELVKDYDEACFQDKNGYTALIRAVVFNQVEVVRHLCISRPVLKSTPDNCNRYPLHYACLMPVDQAKVLVKVLLERDPEEAEKKVDKDGRFPVEYKSLQGSSEGLWLLYNARTLDAYGERGNPLGIWPDSAMTGPPEEEESGEC